MIKKDPQFEVRKAQTKKIKAKKPKNLDDLFRNEHERVFDKTDCLACANCCKTTSPIFYDVDIDRLAKYLKMSSFDFETKYLTKDNDGCKVLKQSPCAFLDYENYCTVYDARPKACREYPHTDRRRMIQIMDLTLENTKICPAVEQIFDKVALQLGL